MPLGDILVIDDGHKKAGADIAEMVAKNWKGEKLSLAVGAESGAGKSEIAHQVASNLFKSELGLKSFIVHTDDFFALPHKERNDLRQSSNLESVGPGEIDLDELDYVLQSFNSGKRILLPVLEFITSSAYQLLVDFSQVQVLICEGLYAPMLDVSYKIFIDMIYHDTQEFRVRRGKEVVNEFRMKVFEREHQAVRELRRNVDYLIAKDYSLTKA